MYTYTSGLQAEVPKGRETARGHAIGIIFMKDERTLFIPGCVENATTYDFPVLYETIESDYTKVVTDKPDPAVAKQFAEGAKRLEKQGCRAIIANCGYSANFLPEIVKEINVPAFVSSLMLVPLIALSLRPDRKVGIVCFSSTVLGTAPALDNCGIDRSRIVITGAQELSQVKAIDTTGQYNPSLLGQELVGLHKKFVSENPDIGAILLECSMFPPYASAVQEAVRMPVFDFTTMINFAYNAVVRRPFAGYL